VSRRRDPLRFLSPERYEKEPPAALVGRFDVRSGDRVLDLGCGPGFFSDALLDAAMPGGALAVLDASEEMIEAFMAHSPAAAAARTVTAKVPPVPFDDASFDFVWAAHVLHEFDPLPVVLAEVFRVLAPGGRLVCVDWAPVPTEHGPSLSKRIRPEAAAEFLKEAGFERVKWGAIGREKYYVRGVRLT